jgi:hypothetical protein
MQQSGVIPDRGNAILDAGRPDAKLVALIQCAGIGGVEPDDYEITLAIELGKWLPHDLLIGSK